MNEYGLHKIISVLIVTRAYIHYEDTALLI